MSASPAGRRLHSFRLADIPEGLRLRALDKLLKTDGSADGMLVPSFSVTERIQLGIAAEQPSGRVYWISEQAWRRVMEKRRGR